MNLGPLDRFDDGQPDYVDRLKKSFKAGNPLIPALNPYCSSEKSAETYRFSIQEGSLDCFGHPKLSSHVLLERIQSEEGILLRVNRSIQVEGSFGELKQDMQFRRYMSRGAANVLAESVLLTMAGNINKLHNKIQNDRTGVSIGLNQPDFIGLI